MALIEVRAQEPLNQVLQNHDTLKWESSNHPSHTSLIKGATIHTKEIKSHSVENRQYLHFSLA